MSKFDIVLVVTHVNYRSKPSCEPTEGPYSSVCKALAKEGESVYACLLPMTGFDHELRYGQWPNLNKTKIPSILGKVVPLKYLIDFFIVSVHALIFNASKKNEKKLFIGIDPLSCLPLVLLKKLFRLKLVFYSVDFNKKRFSNKLLQQFYEKADKICSRVSNQVWVVSESLKDYKWNNYKVKSLYIPNAPVFNSDVYNKNKLLKKGNKIAWTGGTLNERWYNYLFNVLKEIEKIRPDMEFYFAPISSHEDFEKYSQKYKLRKWRVLHLHSRSEWQEFAAKCDVGIAVYDDQFGSTEFIEPLKIWDYMMCCLPFIISCEPSISTPIKESGVAYFLAPHNKIPKDNSLKEFLKKENIARLQEKCIELAKEFDIQKQIEKALDKKD